MFPYFQVSGGEVVHHPVSVFNPFNDVMQITQVNNVRMCIFGHSDSTDSTPIRIIGCLKGLVTHVRRFQPTTPSYSSWHLVNFVRPGMPGFGL